MHVNTTLTIMHLANSRSIATIDNRVSQHIQLLCLVKIAPTNSKKYPISSLVVDIIDWFHILNIVVDRWIPTCRVLLCSCDDTHCWCDTLSTVYTPIKHFNKYITLCYCVVSGCWYNYCCCYYCSSHYYY